MAIRLINYVNNQKSSPALYTGAFSERPAAGIFGRLFMSVDTYQIFQDQITGWSLLADAGTGSSNLQQVTTNGNSTTAGILILGNDLTITSTGKINVNSYISGGVLFPTTSSGTISQDAVNFFWDDTNNRLGIGTATPSAKLDIHGTGINAVLNGTGSNPSYIVFQNAGTSKWYAGNAFSSAVANDFIIYDAVNATPRFYVHNTGVVNIPTSLIIGSSTPTSIYSLDVTGSGNFSAGLNAGFFNATTATIPANGMYLSGANTLNFATNTTNRFSISSTGVTTFTNSVIATSFEVGNGQFYTARRNSGSLLINLLGIESGTDNTRLLITNDFNIVNGSTVSQFKINSSGNIEIPNSVSIGTTISSNTRLIVKGGDSTSSNNSFIAQNSSNATLLSVRNDGLVTIPSLVSTFTTAALANMWTNPADGSISRSTASSLRFKENIIDWDESGLNTILALKPKTFTYKEDYYNNPNRQFLGLIAEEVAEVSTYLADYENEDGSGQVENVRYATIVVPLIKAIQELNEKLVRNNIN